LTPPVTTIKGLAPRNITTGNVPFRGERRIEGVNPSHHTRKQIAEALDIDQKTASNVLDSFRKNGIGTEIPNGFKPELYDVWTLKRRKESYEILHPETVSVNIKGGPGRSKKIIPRNGTVLTFVKDTRNKTGKSKSTIYTELEIATKLAPGDR
jgi:hypothetical protein